MSEVKVNKISPRTNCGTVQLGDSGDTITIPSGATITNNGTQTGFGRTGTVDWQTSIKTSTITVTNGEGYFVDTSSGAITANLPAGTSGSIAAFRDYANSFDSNNLTIAANGSQKINGLTDDLVISTEGESLTLVYADDTKGWLVVNDGNNDAGSQAKFVTATGGTITTVCTNFKVHTFTGPGTFCVSCGGNSSGSNTVDYLVIAGGGGGGKSRGGGGGAGGYRESPGAASGCYSVSPLGAAPAAALPVSVQGYPITVGAGGPGVDSPGPNVGPGPTSGHSGSNSIFSTITSTGGGAGSSNTPPEAGQDGGSGGGSAGQANPGGGSGNTPPVNPAQGTNGGQGSNPSNPVGGGDGEFGAGGGGATVAGKPGAQPGAKGVGGTGATSSINGTPTTRAGGGGGGGNFNQASQFGTASGGGGAGSAVPGPGNNSSAGTSGTANTGGGGGGSAGVQPNCQQVGNGGAGGSGIVIIRYRFQ